MAALKWLGWSVYTDSGILYRRWQFEEAVPEFKADPNDVLDDRGPEVSPRFLVRKYARSGPWERVCTPTEEELAASDVLPGSFPPPWAPPAPEGFILKGSMEELRDAVRDVARAIRSGSDASRKLEEVRQIVDGEPTPQTEPGVSNRFLRLKGEHEYSSGDPFTDWELLVDVPEIPVTRTAASPRHAMKGDILREEADEDLTPFQLRRGGRRIGDPEWWQVRHLFEGLKEGVEEGAPAAGWGDPPSTPDGHLLRQILPRGARKLRYTGGKSQLGLLEAEDNGSDFLGSAWIATEAVKAVGVRKGDILLFSSWYNLRKSDRELFDRGRQPPRPHFPALLDALDSLRFIDASGCVNPTPRGGWCSPVPREDEARRELRRYFGRKASWKGKTESVKVCLFTPRVEVVSAPITAKTDQEAVFELLYQVERGLTVE